jgi:hypothetical protein
MRGPAVGNYLDRLQQGRSKERQEKTGAEQGLHEKELKMPQHHSRNAQTTRQA